jgi:sarcosine oxidase gamma subunit
VDESYETWIANLMTGTISAEEQAMRAKFRAMQASKPQAPVRRPASVETTGPNTWAVSTGDGDDALTTFTHLAGPGISGLIAGR